MTENLAWYLKQLSNWFICQSQGSATLYFLSMSCARIIHISDPSLRAYSFVSKKKKKKLAIWLLSMVAFCPSLRNNSSQRNKNVGTLTIQETCQHSPGNFLSTPLFAVSSWSRVAAAYSMQHLLVTLCAFSGCLHSSSQRTSENQH